MLLMSSILILLSNVVTFKRDKAISFNGIIIIVLFLSSVLDYEMLFLLSLLSGYGIYSNLYQVSSLTQIFVVLILSVTFLYYKNLEHKGNIFNNESDSNERLYFKFKEKNLIPLRSTI